MDLGFFSFLLFLAWPLDAYLRRRKAKRVRSAAVHRNTRALAEVPNFSRDVMFAGGAGEGGLAIDAAGNSFAVNRPNQPADVFSFDQLVAVHIERDGETVHTTDRGSQAVGAAVGAALFGGAGFLVGGLTGSSKSSFKVRRLALKIYTNDLRSPLSEVVFFDSAKPVGSDDIYMKSRAIQLEEWYARFQAVLHSRQARPLPLQDVSPMSVPR